MSEPKRHRLRNLIKTCIVSRNERYIQMSITRTRTNQGGSVASFVIAGIVMLVLLTGGIYLLQKRSETPAATPVASKSASPSSSTTLSPKTSPSVKPSTSPTPTSQSSQPPATTGNASLPTTGPDDNYALLGIIAVLIISTVSYARSRRAVASVQVD